MRVMARLSSGNNRGGTPLKNIVSQTPKLLDALLQMEEALSEELDERLLEIIRLRVATNNDCYFCKNLDKGIVLDEVRMEVLNKVTSNNLTEKEQLTLEFVDTVMAYHGQVSEDLFQKMKGNFNEKEIIAILFQIGQKNMGGWFNIAVNAQ